MIKALYEALKMIKGFVPAKDSKHSDMLIVHYGSSIYEVKVTRLSKEEQEWHTMSDVIKFLLKVVKEGDS